MKQHKDKKEEFWDRRREDLITICEAIAYHDRKMFPSQELEVKNHVACALRIADELQEWDRQPEDLTFFEETTFKESTSLVDITYKIKSSGNSEDFKPHIAIADKIFGLMPVCNEYNVKICFQLPDKLEGDFKRKLFEEFQTRNSSEYFLNKRSLKKGSLPKWEDSIEFIGTISGAEKISMTVSGFQKKTEIKFDG